MRVRLPMPVREQFGELAIAGSSRDSLTAVAHFTAEAGRIYYFEIKNVSWPQSGEHDATLFPLDSDEGEYLTSTLQMVSSRQKK